MIDRRIAFLGAGNMGNAIIRGLIRAGLAKEKGQVHFSLMPLQPYPQDALFDLHHAEKYQKYRIWLHSIATHTMSLYQALLQQEQNQQSFWPTRQE